MPDEVKTEQVIVYDLLASSPGKRIWYYEDFQPRVDANCAKVAVRFKPVSEPRRPLALVGFGPSLCEEWLGIAGFEDIWTVSGAHDYLLSKNIVPTYHTDVEWRDHKIKFIKKLHPEIHYILASTIAENYIERFTTEQITLFHVEQHPDSVTYPEGEYIVSADWDVTQMVIHLAVAMGYTEIHLFGVDYCYQLSSGKVAATEHFGIPKENLYMQIHDRIYLSSKDMVEGCQSIPHVMKKYPHVTFAIHGPGMLRDYLQEIIAGEYKPYDPNDLERV